MTMRSRTPRHAKFLSLSALLCFLILPELHAEDWPTFGRDATRNAVSPEKNSPLDWDVGKLDRKTGKWVGARNIKDGAVGITHDR
jgi:hypothetical protein